MRLTGLKAAVLAAVVALAAASPASAWWRGDYGGFWPYGGYWGNYYTYSPWYWGGNYTYPYAYYPATYATNPYLYSYYPSASYYPRYAAYPPSYALPATAVTAAPVAGTIQSMYPPDAASPAATANVAVVRVQTAPDAQLWFDGVATTQTGPVRTFSTPELRPGKGFEYDVKVRWMQDGQPVERQRTITVSAGQTVNVDLTPANLLR